MKQYAIALVKRGEVQSDHFLLLELTQLSEHSIAVPMLIPSLTETIIRDHATPEVFQRGEGYYQAGAVVDICQRDDTIQATVEGNEVEPYRVSIQFDSGGFKQVSCTCAYDWAGWCKHIVATALVCLRQPETINLRPSLEQLLDRLDLVQTQRLVQELIAEEPELVARIDRLVTRITQPIPQSVTKAKRQTAVDPQPYRSQVKRLMQNALHYWEEGVVFEALKVAQYGLTLPESNRSYSHWVTIGQFEIVGVSRYELADWTSILL